MADSTDGKLIPFDGQNLSHVWMLEGIVARLPKGGDPRPALIVLAVHLASDCDFPNQHLAAGNKSIIYNTSSQDMAELWAQPTKVQSTWGGSAYKSAISLLEVL